MTLFENPSHTCLSVCKQPEIVIIKLFSGPRFASKCAKSYA